MYDYLLTVFKLLIGLITPQRLIYASLAGLAIYLIWICFSLAFSFQRRFNRNCVKLYNFVKKHGINANDNNFVDIKASKISSGFSHGWKKFKTSSYGKPSDFITRRDALDVEVNGGVLNQGKTIMRTFVNIATFVLFVANFAYLGNNSTITFYILAESLVLPTVFFVVLKICYFVYTSVKQQLYKADIECLYELLDLLDQVFAKGDQAVMAQIPNSFVHGEDMIATSEGEELPALEVEESENSETEETASLKETETPVEENKEDEKENEEESIASKYDFFKKKNIDVDKILSDGSTMSSTSALPYINVDSDYVIKDDDVAVSKTINNLENGSELLGSMMQDMGSIKKLKKEEEEKVEAEKAEAEAKEKEEAEKNAAEEEAKNKESDDPFDSLGQFEVAENAKTVIVAEPDNTETETEPVEKEPEKVEEEEEVKLEIPDVEPIEIEKPEVEETEEVQEEILQDDISDERRENIASVVGGFKAKSKLASGGVVIERNQPISRRDKTQTYSNDYSDENTGYEDNNYTSNGITHLSAESNADSILNTFRSSAGGYDDYQNYGAGMQNPMYGAGYNQPQYNQGYGYPQGGYNQPQPVSGYGMQNVPNYQQNVQPQGFGGYSAQTPTYEEPDYEEDYDDEYEEEVVEKPVKKPAVKRTKENEPRPRNLKKKESKPVMEEEVKGAKRGRPKKQVFDETVTIKNDKEFDEVLSRAEKLMKKSESGLSASQSKRIEKELKMLMDAMNKYKEGV